MKTVCFRLDANQILGQGHAMRCLTIAKRLYDSGQVNCCFIGSDEQTASFFQNSRFECICLELDYNDYSVSAALKMYEILCDRNADLLVIDSYFVTEPFLCALKNKIKTACFWCREEKISSDIMINYNINYNKDFYKSNYKDETIRLLLGRKYVPLRQEFLENYRFEINREVKSVLILTGGSDPYNFIGKFLEKIQEFNTYKKIKFLCVIGRYNPFYEEVINFCALKNMTNVYLMQNISDMSSVMKKADLVISAGGITMYELCALGIPAILFSIADNQESESLYMNENGVMPYVGSMTETGFWDNLFLVFNKVVMDFDIRKNISCCMKKMIDGKGAKRIADELLNAIFGK